MSSSSPIPIMIVAPFSDVGGPEADRWKRPISIRHQEKHTSTFFIIFIIRD